MLAAPGGGAYGRTVLHNFRLKVIHVFSVGVAVEMVHSFPMMTERTTLAMVAAAEPWVMFKLLSTAEHSTTNWWC